MSSAASTTSTTSRSTHSSSACLRCIYTGVGSTDSLHPLIATPSKHRWTIGRESPADIVTTESKKLHLMVSRQHAAIMFEPCEVLKRRWKRLEEQMQDEKNDDGEEKEEKDDDDEKMEMSDEHSTSAAASSSSTSSRCSCRFRLIDLNSLNGLFLNDIKTKESLLHHGDIIVFGSGHGLEEGARKKHNNYEYTYRFEDTKERERLDAAAKGRAASSAHSTISPSTADNIASSATAAASPSSSSSVASTTSAASTSNSHKRKHVDDSAALEQSRRADQLARDQKLQAEADQREREAQERDRATAAAAKEKEKQEQLEREREREAEALELKRKREEDRRRKEDADRQHKEEAELMQKQKQREAEERKRLEQVEIKKEKRLDEAYEQNKRNLEATNTSSSSVTNASKPKASAGAAPAAASLDGMSEVDLDALLQEHTCPICARLLEVYDELPCTHRVCSLCLQDWLSRRKTTCPYCSQEIDFLFDYRPPALDDIREHDETIEMLAASSLLTDDEKHERAKRYALYEKMAQRDDRRYADLKKYMDAARAAKHTVLQITKPWKEKERATFAQGISAYSYYGRMEYASFVGLTVKFLKECDQLSVLDTILQNIQLDLPEETRAALDSIPEEICTCSMVNDSDMFSIEQRAAFQNAKRHIYLYMAFQQKCEPTATAATASAAAART